MIRRSRILIVDDEPGLVRLLSLMLNRTDRYEVMSVMDATQALQTVVRFKPHLVLLDWVMPKITGGEVAGQIRADSRVSETPILFLSAIVMKRDGCGEVAGFPAIAKPIRLNELLEAIEEQFGKAVNFLKASMEPSKN
jgi:CheY-like chemotaxis protein